LSQGRVAFADKPKTQNEEKNKMNTNYKVSYAFVRLPDTAIGDFTDTVVAALTGNTGFPNLPVTLAELGTEKTTFLTKLAATAQGGTVATSEKNDARAALETSLRKIAAYVQSVASQDLTLLLTSGFSAVSTNRAQTPLDAPVVLDIDNSSSTVLALRVQPVTNAKAYETQYKNGGGWLPAGVTTQARRIEVGSLTPGTTYTVQVRAVGGSTGYSDWSAPMSCIAT
jgi:hypothetical protein